MTIESLEFHSPDGNMKNIMVLGFLIGNGRHPIAEKLEDLIKVSNKKINPALCFHKKVPFGLG